MKPTCCAARLRPCTKYRCPNDQNIKLSSQNIPTDKLSVTNDPILPPPYSAPRCRITTKILPIDVVLNLESDREKTIEKTTTMNNPTIRKPNEGRTIAVVGDVYRFMATSEDTNGKYAMWEAIVPPGGGPPPHVHSREEEGFYILEGEIAFQIGEKHVVATAGMFANMPIGMPHSFKNEGDKPAKMVISVAPAGLEKMFFEFGVPLLEGATTALPPSKEEIEKLLAIAPRYGIEIKVPQHH